MPDFSQFLSRPAGKAVKVPPLPIETYPGKIIQFEHGESAQQHTPYVRFHLRLVGWPDSIPEEGRSYPDRDGGTVPFDLSKMRFRTDFYTTDSALYRLDDFFRTLGIEPEGRTYQELIPQAIGADVSVEVSQYLNQRTNDLGNQVQNIYGPHPLNR